MADLLTASVSEKGQVTLPKPIRTLLGIHPHERVGFRIVKGIVQLFSLEIKEKDPYTSEEWKKIKKLAKQKGKTFNNLDDVLKYLKSI